MSMSEGGVLHAHEVAAAAVRVGVAAAAEDGGGAVDQGRDAAVGGPPRRVRGLGRAVGLRRLVSVGALRRVGGLGRAVRTRRLLGSVGLGTLTVPLVLLLLGRVGIARLLLRGLGVAWNRKRN